MIIFSNKCQFPSEQFVDEIRKVGRKLEKKREKSTQR